MIIPPEFLSMLRSGSLLREVLAERGTVIHRVGPWFKMACPFCGAGRSGDCELEMYETAQVSSYHCTPIISIRAGVVMRGPGPSCGAHGDAIGAVMRLKNLSKDDAVKYLAARLGLEIPPGLEPVTEVGEGAVV